MKKHAVNSQAAHGARNSLNPITLALGVIAALVMAYIAAKYWDSPIAYDSALARYAALLAVFAVAGLAVINWQDPNDSIRWEIQPLTVEYASTLLGRAVVLLLVGLVLEAAITYVGQLELVNSAVADEDLAAYYIFAGVAEEFLFRGVACNLLARYAHHHVAVPASAALFMVAHVQVYGADPALLAVQFVLGVLWGYAYLYWRDITPNVLAHTLKNLMAVGSLLVL